MKKKELKNLAMKIAKYQLVINESDDIQAIHEAQEKIMELSSKVDSLEDIVIIDELVMDLLEKNSKNS